MQFRQDRTLKIAAFQRGNLDENFEIVPSTGVKNMCVEGTPIFLRFSLTIHVPLESCQSVELKICNFGRIGCKTKNTAFKRRMFNTAFSTSIKQLNSKLTGQKILIQDVSPSMLFASSVVVGHKER